MIWQGRVGTFYRTRRVLPLGIWILALALSLWAGSNAGASDLGADLPGSVNSTAKESRGIGLRVGSSFGLLSGDWLRPGVTSFGGDIGLMVPISSYFEVQTVVTVSSIREHKSDTPDYLIEPPSGGSPDLRQWMILFTGYADSHWFDAGKKTAYMNLGFGSVDKRESKFAAQFGGGSLIMIDRNFGVDLGLELDWIFAGSVFAQFGHGFANIMKLRAAVVVRLS